MKEFKLNETLAGLKPSAIRTFNDKISGIEGIIRLTIGEPDYPTPRFIKDAAIAAIDKSFNGYSHSRGILELREVISDYLNRKYNLTYSAEEEIIVTVGATEALFTTFYALLNKGEKVITPSPHYAVYGTQVGLAGGTFVPVDVSDDAFILTPERLSETLAEHPDTKVLLFNYPSNPTGRTYTPEQLKALAEVIKQHNIVVVSDEIYSELTFEGKHVSLATYIPEQTIIINGASKSHSMTGWRMGFIAGPKWILDEIFKVHQSAVNAPSTQAQYAVIEGYAKGDKEVEEMRQGYIERRDLLVEGFERIGFELASPQGAFYLFIKVPDWFEGDDYDFCLKLAEEAKVGLVPGQAFGKAGKRYFRLSYAASTEKLTEALNRIETFVTANKPQA